MSSILKFTRTGRTCKVFRRGKYIGRLTKKTFTPARGVRLSMGELASIRAWAV